MNLNGLNLGVWHWWSCRSPDLVRSEGKGRRQVHLKTCVHLTSHKWAAAHFLRCFLAKT